MPQFLLTLPAHDWDAQDLFALFQDTTKVATTAATTVATTVASIVATHASVSPKWRDTEAEDLQSEMEARYGWPEGTLDRRAGDGPSTLTITLEAESLPEGIQRAVEDGRIDVEEE